MITSKLGSHKFLKAIYSVFAVSGAILFIYALFVSPRWNFLLAPLIFVLFGWVGANDERRKLRQISGVSDKATFNVRQKSGYAENVARASGMFS